MSNQNTTESSKQAYITSENNLNAGQWIDVVTRKPDERTREVTYMLKESGIQIGKEGKFVPEHTYFKNSIEGHNTYKDMIIPSLSKEYMDLLLPTSGELIEKKKKQNKNNKKNNKKKLGGQERAKQIKLETLRKSVDEDMKTLEAIRFTNGMFPLKSNFKNTECELLTFMIWALQEKKKYNVNTTDKYYEAVMSLAKAIKMFQKLVDLDKIKEEEYKLVDTQAKKGKKKKKKNYSKKKTKNVEQKESSIQSVINHAKKVLTYVISEYFSIEELLTKYNRLITKTPYDEAYISSILQPYGHQKQVLMNLKEYLDKDSVSLLTYNPPPDSGKTSLAVAIASMLKQMGNKQLIYTCYNNLVRLGLAHICFVAGIKFAVISNNDIRPSNGCFQPLRAKKRIFSAFRHSPKVEGAKDPVKKLELQMKKLYDPDVCKYFPTVWICDMESSKNMMKLPEMKLKSKNGDKTTIVQSAERRFVAFLDEPTVGSESGVDNYVAQEYAAIMKLCPRITILASATMPNFDRIPNIVNNFCEKYEEKKEKVCSRAYAKQLGVGCRAINKDGYICAPHNCIKSCDELKELIGFLEENPLLLKFYTPDIIMDMLDKVDVPEELQLNNYFGDINIGNVSHNNVRQYALKILKYISDQNDQKMVELISTLSLKVRDVGFDLKTAFTSTAHHHIGSTLYVSKKPYEETLEMSNDFLLNSPDLDAIHSEYQKKLEQYEKEKANIEKNIKNEDVKTRKLQNLCIPQMQWSPEFIINSKQHLNKYTRAKNYDSSLIKPDVLNIPEGVANTIIDPFGKLLQAGVGLYDPYDSKFNGNGGKYTTAVNQLAERGKFSYLISGEQIVYGTNYHITEVVIDPNFGKMASSNTIHQLIGRAGRTGKSSIATVVFRDDDTMRKAFTPSENNIEADTMNMLALIVE